MNLARTNVLAGLALIAIAAAGMVVAPWVRVAMMRGGAPTDQRALAGGTDGAPAPRSEGPVRVVILDGLSRADAGAPPPDALALTIDVGFPTKSLAVQSVLWTGLTPQQTGIAADNLQLAAPPASSIPAQVPGAVAVVESHEGIAGSFGFTRVEVGGDFVEASRAAVESDARLVLVHVLAIDVAAHAGGRETTAYREAVVFGEALASALRVKRPDATWLVLADHGHVARGGHGDIEDEVRRVTAWIAPAPIEVDMKAMKTAEVHLADLARWLAETLGVERDGRAVGRALRVAIAHPDPGATLPSPGPVRWLGALVLVTFGFASAARLRARAWVAVWPLVSIAIVLAIAGVPSLSNRPAGWLLIAAGAAPALAASLLSGTRTSTIAILAPAIAIVVGIALLCGVPGALIGGPPPRMPWWTGGLGASAVALAGAFAAVGARLTVSGVRTLVSVARTAASEGRTDVSASRTPPG